MWSRGSKSSFSSHTEAATSGRRWSVRRLHPREAHRGRLAVALLRPGRYEGGRRRRRYVGRHRALPVDRIPGHRAHQRLGRGRLRGRRPVLRAENAAPVQSGLLMALAAAEMRGTPVADDETFECAFKAAALWVGTRVHGSAGPGGRLQAAGAGVTRLRRALEGSNTFRMGRCRSPQPSVEFGLRQAGGAPRSAAASTWAAAVQRGGYSARHCCAGVEASPGCTGRSWGLDRRIASRLGRLAVGCAGVERLWQLLLLALGAAVAADLPTGVDALVVERPLDGVDVARGRPPADRGASLGARAAPGRWPSSAERTAPGIARTRSAEAYSPREYASLPARR